MPKLKKTNRNENYVPRSVIPRKAKDKALVISENVRKEVIHAKRNSVPISGSKQGASSKRRQEKIKIRGVKFNEDSVGSGIYKIEVVEKHEACALEKTNHNGTENPEPTYRKTGLSHFMDLEERKDLLCTPADDPLGLSGPDGYDALQWASLLRRLHMDFKYSKT